MKKLLRNPLAWSLVLYFGFQSTNYYSLGSWYPTILREAGISPTIAGYQLALMVMTGFPAGLIIPPLATKYKSQVGLCVGSVAFFAAGLLGIYIFSATGWWPNGTWLWSTLLGIGLSTSFPLALTLVLLRTEDQETARDVTSFMQGIGYFISAIGPVVLGVIRDSTNSWNLAYAALAVALLIQLVSGVIVSRPVTIKTN
jgi:CP family cyanate transporter-like MFS transporter